MINLNDQNFEKEIKNSTKPFLVDFYAVWCPPCRLLSPIIEEIAEEFKEKINFGKINIDQSPRLSQLYNIEQVPTVILFKEGKPISFFIGLQTKEKIKNWLEETL